MKRDLLIIILTLGFPIHLFAMPPIEFVDRKNNTDLQMHTQMQLSEKRKMELCLRVKNELTGFNWNSLKKYSAFKKHIFLQRSSNKDLNELPLVSGQPVAYLQDNGAILIHCGQKELARNMVYGVFLETWGQFHAGTAELSKVIIWHNGYFHE